MDIEIPAIPTGVLVLLAFFSPYATAALNGVLGFVQKPWQKKLVAIVVALVLAAVVIVAYYGMTGAVITDWWAFALLAIVIAQAAYALLLKPSAKAVEHSVESGAPSQ